jgi:hypothetical protein
MKKLVLLMMLMMAMVGCKTTSSTVSVQVRDSIRIVDSIRDSVNYVTKHNIKDSVRYKDSTVLVLDSTGKVMQQKEYHSKEVYHHETDSSAYYKSLAKQATEELVKERNSKKEVVIEKPLSLWQRVKVEYGGYAIVAVCLFLLFFVWKLLKKFNIVK